MDVGAIIAIAIVAIIAIALFSVLSKRRSARKNVELRGKAQEHRQEARVRDARADRAAAEAEERAARAKREQAMAEEHAAAAERERRFAREKHEHANELDPDHDGQTTVPERSRRCARRDVTGEGARRLQLPPSRTHRLTPDVGTVPLSHPDSRGLSLYFSA